MTVYGDLGATYGEHTTRTYGTLFDATDVPITGGLVRLFARVARSDIGAEVALTGVRAQVTTLPVGAQIN